MSPRAKALAPDDVDTIVEFSVEQLPDEVKESLGHIDVQLVVGVTDPALEDVRDEEGQALPADFRGFYQGTVVEGGDDDEDEADPPEGIIYLNCEQLFSESDVVQTLYHEIGHALGLSEDEVEHLGL